MIKNVNIDRNNILKMDEEIEKLEKKYAAEYDYYEEPQGAVILGFEEAKARIEKQKQQETRANIQNIQEEQVINKEKNSLSSKRTAESKTSVNQARRKPSPKSRRKKKKIKFKTMTGIIIAAAVVSTGVGVAVARSSRDDNTATTDDTYVVDNTIYANTTDLNDFNLVIVNDGVNDYFLDSFTSNLTSKGIEFQVANGSDSLTGVNGSEVFIGLLPYDNPGMTRVIAQYEEKDNQSDVMAVALRNSLLKNDLTSDTIQCGVWRYDESAEKHLVESPLEHKVTYSSNRFVSVEVNDSVDVNKFTSSFVEGMLRYKNYVENSSDFDLFTRVKGGDTLEAIASAHNTSYATLANINGLPSPDNVAYNTTLMFPASSDILYNRELVIDDVNTKGRAY